METLRTFFTYQVYGVLVWLGVLPVAAYVILTLLYRFKAGPPKSPEARKALLKVHPHLDPEIRGDTRSWLFEESEGSPGARSSSLGPPGKRSRESESPEPVGAKPHGGSREEG
ncbi:MAG: hypothetical protein ABIH26_05845 [Candidatus Eisenbacteria bacterium]